MGVVVKFAVAALVLMVATAAPAVPADVATEQKAVVAEAKVVVADDHAHDHA